MDDLEWILAVKEISGKANGLSIVDDLLKLYLVEDNFREKLKLRRDIQQILSFHTTRFLFSKKPILNVPSQEEANGEIVLGKILQENELYNFGLLEEELNQHMLIIARSGHGKTVLIMRILVELIKRNIPWLSFDFKRDYRHLIREYPIWVIRWEDLRFSPLTPPPDVSLHKWKQIFADVFSHCFGFFHGSRNFLLEFLDVLYRRKGERATLTELYDLMSSVQINTRKRQEYFDVVLNRLYSVISNLGEVINCERGFRIEKLLDHFVVIELDGLGRDEQNLLIELFLAWIYAYRLSQGHRGELKHVLIFDEAKRVFDVNKEYKQSTTELGVAPIDIITDEIRDFGEALIIADQEPSKLTHSIKANTYTKITGNLGHGRDINDVAEAMDLSSDERNVIPKLERGEWIVKLSGRFTKPFMIKSANLSIKKDVTDEEVRKRFKSIVSELGDVLKPEDREEIELPEISEDAMNLIIDVCYHPFRSLSNRCRSLELSWRRFERARDEIVENSLAEEVSITLGGKRLKFLVLTELGIELLRSLGHDTGLWRFAGRTGFEHKLFQVLIAYRLREVGYDVFMERDVNGKRLDILAIGEKRIGVEIVITPNMNAGLLNSCLNELDELVIACKDSDILKIVKKTISSSVSENTIAKIRFVTLDSYLNSFNNDRGDCGDHLPAEKTVNPFSFSRRRYGDRSGGEL